MIKKKAKRHEAPEGMKVVLEMIGKLRKEEGEKMADQPRPGSPGKSTERMNEGTLLWTLSESIPDKTRVTNLFSQAITELKMQSPPEDKQFYFEAGQIFYKDGKIEEVRLSGLICDESGEQRKWKTPDPPHIINKSAYVGPAQYIQIYELDVKDKGRKHLSILISRPEQAQDERGFIYQFWDLEEPIQFQEVSSCIESDAPSILPPYISVPSPLVYHRLQNVLAVANQEFSQLDERGFPRADLSTPNESLKAVAVLKPSQIDDLDYIEKDILIKWQEEMRRKILKMDDETADVLDALSLVWLKKAENPESYANINSYDILQLRGVKPRKCGSGYRSRKSYKKEQYAKTAFNIGVLSDTWITVMEMEVSEQRTNRSGRPYTVRKPYIGESRAIVVKDRYGQKKLSGSVDTTKNVTWRYQLGTVFAQSLFNGTGRETALLSCKALNYDPYRRQWEKRLTRYFAWQWRIRQSRGKYLQPYTVETLLVEAIKEPVNTKKPQRTKDRLEKALDKLFDDKVINAWQYEEWDENVMNDRKWWKKWLETKIIIEPPQAIMDHYAQIMTVQKTIKALPEPKKQEITITEVRKRKGLTLTQAAEQIGISPSQLSEAERGVKGHVGKRTFDKIKKWITQNSE